MNTNSCSRRSPTAVLFFYGDPSFTRFRRSMSLTEVRRLDMLKCKVGRRTTQQRELIQSQDL
jgi:hypothetical protein